LTATGARRGLLQRDGITTVNLVTLQHRSIHANISVVVLGCRTQDPRIFGEIALRERRELLLAVRSLYDNVRAKPSDLEASPRIQHS
jgi:hypothetical protein